MTAPVLRSSATTLPRNVTGFCAASSATEAIPTMTRRPETTGDEYALAYCWASTFIFQISVPVDASRQCSVVAPSRTYTRRSRTVGDDVPVAARLSHCTCPPRGSSDAVPCNDTTYTWPPTTAGVPFTGPGADHRHTTRRRRADAGVIPAPTFWNVERLSWDRWGQSPAAPTGDGAASAPPATRRTVSYTHLRAHET